MATQTKKPVNDLSAFRASHDPNVIVPAKIKAALAQMLAEHKEAWRYEADLLKLAGISTTQLALFRGQFEAHVVETKGNNAKRVWFADAKVAASARETQI